MKEAVSAELITTRILEIRGKKVMLDSDLAKLYGVKTKRLIEQVTRNKKRFPDDFTYQLTGQEVAILRSQFATSSWGGRRYFPYVFTQEGVAMLSSVLNSERAIQVNITIMRDFIKLREVFLTNKDLAIRLEALEKKYADHDDKIKYIFEAIRQLLAPPKEEPKKKIGFHS